MSSHASCRRLRLVVSLAAAIVTAKAYATTFIVPDDGVLIRKADAIVTAIVIDDRCEVTADGSVRTATEIWITDVLKGVFQRDQTLTIRQPGGVTPVLSASTDGDAHFHVGDRVLLFLTHDTRYEWTLQDMALGKFDYTTDVEGRRLLLREKDQICGWRPHLRPYRERARREKEFLDYVRHVVRGETPTADYELDYDAICLPDAQSAAVTPSYSPIAYVMEWCNCRWPNPTVTFLTHGTQTGYSDSLGSVDRATGVWNADSGSNVAYSRGGTTTTSSGSSHYDGINSIQFNDPAGEIAGSFTGTGVVARGVPWASGSHSFDGQAFNSIVGADVTVQDGVSPSTGITLGELDAIIAHELGHTLGFRHPDQAGAPGPPASDGSPATAQLMSSVVSRDHAYLSRWDEDAVRAVYGVPCISFSIDPAGISPGAAAGSQTVSITGSPSGCTGGSWSASSNASWITVSPGAGSGSGSVTVSYTQNTGTSPRTTTAAIAGHTFTISQSAPSATTCGSFSINPTSISPGAAAGSQPVSVTGSPSGCKGGSWSASGNGSWITVSAASGSGSGSVTVAYAQNATTSPRSGTASIAGSTFTVSQSGGSGNTCDSFTLNPPFATVPSTAGSRVVTVIASPAGCTGSWSATGNGKWFTASPTSGSGSGSVTLSYTQNTTVHSRWDKVMIGRNTFTLVQNGSVDGDLLNNGTFNWDLTGWEHVDLTPTWIGKDAAGSTSSGSVTLSDYRVPAACSAAATQVVTVQGGARYHLESKVFIPAAQGTSGEAQVIVFWFDFAGQWLNLSDSISTKVTGSWQRIAVDATAPAAATRAQVMLRFCKSTGAPFGVYWDDVHFVRACVRDSTTACILNGRFKARLRYRAAFDDGEEDTDAFVKAVNGFASNYYESAFFYFNDPNNIELILKVLDQGNTNDQGQPTIAVLFGTATPLRAELLLTDTNTGAGQVYRSDFGTMQGGADFIAFARNEPPGANASLSFPEPRLDGPLVRGEFSSMMTPQAPCIPNNRTACLLNGRFRATVRYRSNFSDGAPGADALLKAVTGFANSAYETAFFYFNSENNIELLLKMLDQGNTDAQGNPTIAVLFGTATPLVTEVTITDTKSGTSKTYSSAFGRMQGATDFTAFRR